MEIKMKKGNIALILSSILTLVTSNSLFAGNRPCAITLTASEAYYHFSTKRNLDGKGMPNLALAFNLNNSWAIEGTAGLINAGRLRSYPLPESKAGVHGYLYMVNAIYRFSPFLGYEPYITAGGGMMTLSPTNYSKTQGNVNAGIGSQFFVTKSTALRLEARDIYTPSGGKNDYMVNLGLSFLIGGQRQPCCEDTTPCKGMLYRDGKLI